MAFSNRKVAGSRGNRTKLLVILAFCIVLAVLLGAQAASSVLTRKAPEQAVSLFGPNGLAREQFAFREFQASVTTPADAVEAAFGARPEALAAVAREPLVPKAYAILALSSPNAGKKSELLALAAKLNRRDIALQGLVLEQALAEGDYDRVVTTLDQILRVHPDFRQQFYSVLLEALAVPEAAPAFVRLLDGTSPWHEDFLLRAARKTQVQPVLAGVREDLFITNTEFDRRLIAGLVQQGEGAEAASVYNFVSASASSAEGREQGLSWRSEFPPFDWRLASRNDFRAQTSRDGESLEIYARAGQGGVVAQRILAVPSSVLLFEMTVESARDLGPQNMRLQLRCSDAREAFFEEPLSTGPNRMSVPEIPEECPGISLEIYARAMSGEPNLRANMGRIMIGNEREAQDPLDRLRG